MIRFAGTTKGTWALAAVIVVAVGAAYWNSLATPFVFDDLPAIVDNPTIRKLSDLRAVLAPPSDGSSATGRPLVNLSFAIDYARGGASARHFHFSNLLIHAAAALALFGLVRRTSLKPTVRARLFAAGTPQPGGLATMLGASVALLWALHPLLTESVTFIVQRTESLMGLFYLLTFYCFARATDVDTTRPAVWLILAVLGCVVGMACKEVMVTAPILLLLYDRTFVSGTFRDAWRLRWRFHVAGLATWLVLLLLVFGAGGTRGAGAGFGLGVTWWSYALTQCNALLVYLKLSLWPHPLVIDYGAGVVTSLHAVALQGIVILALLTGTAVAVVQRPLLGFLGAWFFVILAPSSSVLPLIGQTIAEHRMYLPLVAVVAGVVLLLFRFVGRAGFVACAALAVACACGTAARNRTYRDGETLWADTVAKRPANYRAHYNLAVELGKTPTRVPEAIAEYEAALGLEPNYPDAHLNLAVLLAQSGRGAEAVAHYEQALRLRPQSADAHYNFALLLGGIPGRGGDAIREYQAALALKPDMAEAHNNLAVELARTPGRLPAAITHYETALRLRPDYFEAEYGLANALAVWPDRSAEAITHYEAAARLRPDVLDIHSRLAELYYRANRITDAIAQLEIVLQLDPTKRDARQNLQMLRARRPAMER